MESDKNDNKKPEIKNLDNNNNNKKPSEKEHSQKVTDTTNNEKNNNILNKKTKRLKKKSKNKNKNNNKHSFNNNNFQNRKLEPIEQLYQKAKNLYEKKAISYDLDKIDYNQKVNKEKRWTHDILQKGTYDDKISALLLYIRQAPTMTLKYLEILIRLAENKNRRKNDGVIVGLKDLFLESILNNKKYLAFNQKYNNKNKDGLNNINDEELINSYYDDKIHHLYLRFINLLEETINNESIINIRKKNLDYLYEMLVKQPESEEKILQDIVNKLGDTATEVKNHTMKLLKQIQEQHMNMSTVIFKYVTTFYTMNNKNEAKLSALNYLVQMEIPHGNNKVFLEESINFFFNLFNQISSESDNNNNIREKDVKMEKNKKKQKKLKKIILENRNQTSINEKFLSLIVRRINYLFKYVKKQQKQMEKINEIIHKKISVLFKLSYNKSLKLSIEILKLLFGIITTQDQNFVDRYYKSLYELISNSSLSSSKHVKEALKLILMSLMFDNNNNRICSFIKRLLEMSLISEPQYIICNLLIISQVLRNKNKLWKMIEREQTKINVFYDTAKRDPQYAQGEHSFLNELYLLQKHYHPSVQRMSKFILQNYNKEIISYDGDPLIDFSLINFLEKFMLKNPKIKKAKKEIKVIENDDDELQKFLKADEDNQNNNNINDNNNEGEKNENDFEFIEKFNKIYPEITSDKNYIKKMKKKEKKLKNEDDVDDIIGDKEFDQGKQEDIEEFADKVIEDEYKKYGKDIDDDDLGDFQDEDAEEDENEGENEEEDNKNEDNDDNNEEDEGNEENENIDSDENGEEVEDLFTEDENENEEDEDNYDDEELEYDDEEENNKKKNKKRNKDEKDSGFVDAEEYYKSLKNKNKNKKKKIK